jgi:Protein of unknown function (DUF3618)
MNAAAGSRGAGRNTADLERDSEVIRADMDRTIEALESKFSPREVMDRSLGYLREHGAEIVASVGDTVRSNPVPVAMTAAGLVWLAASIVSRRGESVSTDDARSYDSDEFEEGDDDWQDTDEREAGSFAATEREDADERAKDPSSAPRIVRHKLAHSAKAVRRQVGEARRSATQSVAEQPVFWGVLALAAGALFGSAFPTTEYERRAASFNPRPAARNRTATSGASEDTGEVNKDDVTYKV